MIKKKLKIDGTYLIKLDDKTDKRGSFTRIFCKKNFKKLGLQSKILQINISNNIQKGIIRGFHYQSKKFSEIKRIMVVQGKIYDVIIDTRKNSKTFGKKYSLILSDKKKEMLYFPKGIAHAFQALKNNSKIIYINDNVYSKKFERGFNYNSKKFKIKWPIKVKNVSKKDRSLKDWNFYFQKL